MREKPKLLIVGSLLVVIAALGVVLDNVSAQPTEQWVARYDYGKDEAKAIAVDSLSGNVYLTGWSWTPETTYLGSTLAYDSEGNLLWVAQYDEGDVDHANDIAIDSSSGHVYVTGDSYSNATNYDCVTIAYDSSGTELWVARYNGGFYDTANAIAVDPLSGNVYVTGSSSGGVTGHDYFTIAYDSSGTELWVARYNGPGNSTDQAYAIAVDSSSGNVYVTGSSSGSETFRDYATVAYDSSTGAEEWVARYDYDGPGNLNDVAQAIAVDSSSGNVYVTGGSDGSATSTDCATLAYDSSGNELWVARYNGPGNGSDVAEAITVDSSSGNVYVTGGSTGSGTSTDCATLAYNPSGTQLWVARYHGGTHDAANAIAVDPSRGLVYVAGESYRSGTGFDYVTVAYDSSTGAEEWVARYNEPGNGEDKAYAIALDTQGNVYVTGKSHGGETTNYDYATIKYSQYSLTGLAELLDNLVAGGVIAEELQNSLLSKVENAEKSATKDNICAAINKLEALINEVNAQRGNKIPDGDADEVIAYTEGVIARLLDQLPDGESC